MIDWSLEDRLHLMELPVVVVVCCRLDWLVRIYLELEAALLMLLGSTLVHLPLH